MNSLENEDLVKFCKILSGVYSNFEQAQKEPHLYAHINIYFIPISCDMFRAPTFYSEQSYDYSPWTPYRQAIHKVIKRKNLFIVQNFNIKNAERLAGSGIHPELLRCFNKDLLKERKGCSMIFKEIDNKKYSGEIERGKSCIIKKGNKLTYLKSTVELDKNKWISLDEGFDIKTNQKIWGSEHGALHFKRITNLESKVNQLWNINDQLGKDF